MPNYSLYLVHSCMTNILFIYCCEFRFRECVDWVKKHYFQGTEQRAEFLPVDWRSQCSFDGGKVFKLKK